MWMERQAINNPTFTNYQDIGKAVGDWTTYYSKRHGKAISNSLHNELPIHIELLTKPKVGNNRLSSSWNSLISKVHFNV